MFQLLIQWLAIALVLFTIAGLAVKRRLGRCFAFTAYLAIVASTDVLIALWPDRFNTWNFWMGKETLLVFLKIGIAVEVGRKALGVLPAIHTTWQWLVAALLAATALAGLLSHTGELHVAQVARTAVPPIQYGTAWLFGALGVLVLWYHVPLDPLHKAILLGLVPYLLVFTGALHVMQLLGWGVTAKAGYANAGCYLMVLLFWSYAAWRSEIDPTRADPEALTALKRLQPWR